MVERAEAWAALAVVALLPLVQALLLLAAGYVGARLASRAAGAAVRRMGEERLEPATEVLRSAGLSIAVPDVARRLVFVTVLVVVIAQASAVAGLGYFGNLADSIIRTIPAVCIGLAFLLAGIVAGRQAGRLVAAMALRGPVPAGLAGAATQAAIVAAAAVSAVDAMGISTTLPVALIALSVAALFGLAVAAGVLAARGRAREHRRGPLRRRDAYRGPTGPLPRRGGGGRGDRDTGHGPAHCRGHAGHRPQLAAATRSNLRDRPGGGPANGRTPRKT